MGLTVSGGTWMVTLGRLGCKFAGWEAAGHASGSIWRYLGGNLEAGGCSGAPQAEAPCRGDAKMPLWGGGTPG